MPQAEAVNIAVLMPAEGIVVCPFLPPIPQMSKVSGQVNALQPLPCLGKQCAIYDGCQGFYSRKMTKARMLVRLKEGVTILEKMSSVAFIGPAISTIVTALKERIIKEEAPEAPEGKA